MAALVLPVMAQRGIEPTHYFKLINCLPATPSGYTSSKPQGAKITNTSGILVTEANRQYANKTNRDKVIRIKITDGAYNRSLYGEFERTEDFKKEWADGYFKGYKLDGYPVHERYSGYKAEATLRGVVEGRFIIEINGFAVGPGELIEWWRRTSIKGLAAMH